MKQGVGEAVGSDKLANEGATRSQRPCPASPGAVKEGVHDAANDRKPQAEATAHDVREKITSTAANVKEQVQDAFRDKKAS